MAGHIILRISHLHMLILHLMRVNLSHRSLVMVLGMLHISSRKILNSATYRLPRVEVLRVALELLQDTTLTHIQVIGHHIVLVLGNTQIIIIFRVASPSGFGVLAIGVGKVMAACEAIDGLLLRGITRCGSEIQLTWCQRLVFDQIGWDLLVRGQERRVMANTKSPWWSLFLVHDCWVWSEK